MVIEAGNATDINKSLYDDATTSIAEDPKDTKKWVKHGYHYDTLSCIILRSSYKKSKTVTPTPALDGQLKVKAPKKPVGCAWTNNGWKNDGGDYGKRKTSVFDKEVSTKKGALLVNGGFDDTLELSLSKIYCKRLNTYGKWRDKKLS